MTPEDIRHLAELSRLALSPEEQERLLRDIPAVLEYVSELSSVATEESAPEKGARMNILRSDELPHDPGAFTDAVIANMPRHEKGYLAVKQIIEK